MMKLLLLVSVLVNVTLLVASEPSPSSSSGRSSSTTVEDSGDCSDNDGDGGVDEKKCGANETYLECPEAQCVPRRCSELGMPISCPDQPKDGSCPGKPACVCVDGFVRDENNVCIPSSDCPSCGGDKNKRAGCGVYCNQHCSDINAEDPKACIDICYFNACDCKPGFYLNSKGDCVRPDQCDVQKCGANETYLECPEAQCVPRKCCELGMPISCPDQAKDGSCPGKPACVCVDGFVRDENDVCIPSSDCPSCGGDKNKRAGCGVYCNQHCSDIDAEDPRGCIQICYFNACDCKPGFYLNSKGDCVRPDQCDVPPACKKNEVFSNCTNGGCDARNCSQLGTPVPCVKLDPAACKKGCICIDGYLRADNGTCIPKSQCPSCGGDPNAKPGCGINCGKRCSTFKSKSPVCPKICKVNGCDCKDKYVFDDNLGICVLPKDCTPTCKVNEVFSNCTNSGCDARNCSQLGYPVPCVDIDEASCKKGCVCEQGYLRADNGTCIPKAQCPSCGGDPNAKPGCGVNCGKRCSTYKIKSPICPRICKVNGCDCKDKYVFDDNLGICVLPKDCTPTCQKNEVFSNCTNSGCDARNCSQLGYPVPCVDIDEASCKKGCVCEQGYLRADNGTCIPKDQCPSCGGDPNAKPGCGVNCGKRCSTYKIKSPICPRICKVNGCDCKDKYVFDDNLGICVLPKDCTPTCQVNEVFSNCTNGGCSARNCSQLGFPVPCVKLDPASCKKGCICKEGYLRAANGTCIPKSECPSCGGDPNAKSGCGFNCGKRCSTYKAKPNPLVCPRICLPNACDCKDNYVFDDNLKKCVLPKHCTPTCQVNEVFSNCTNSGCDARNCSQLGYPVPCVDIDEASCKKGCVCEQGYLRAKNGTCIPKDECPSCGGDPNAKSGCGNHCGNSCSTYKKPVPCPLFCLLNGCDCKENYVYDNNLQKCVRPKDCTPTCQVNEVFSNCTNGGCDARNCSQLGFPVPCVKLDPASCKKGCVCKEDYLRAKNGTCIPSNECPSCGGDPNARPGCGVHCGNTCSTYKNKPVACPLICQLNGCDCKPNYVYDTNTKKCVLPKDCTPTCLPHEVYTSCANAACVARNCSQYGKPMPDHCVPPRICIGGCVCEKGYLRAKNGSCIPETQCSKSSTCTSTTTTTTTTVAPSTGQCSDGDAEQCLISGNVDFTLKCLYELIKLNAGKSIVMSPFSLFIPLAELALCTGPGDSYNQLMDALNLSTKDQIRSVFPVLLSSLKSQQDAILDLGAKIYVSKDSQLTSKFENDTLQIFGAKAENVDFSNSQNAANTINAWVEEVTRGLIQNLVSPGMFSAYTRLVLVNAIYFLGNWQTQFNPNNTQTEDFHVTSDKTVQVPMMFRKGSFKYAESSELDCKILEILYKGGNFSYVIFLPNEVDGYNTLAEKIKNPAVLNQALDSLAYQTCLLYIPRHDIDSTIDLKTILQTLNITGIFDSNTANLSGILEGNEQLSVSSGIQKAKIKMNEVGTEAAAANALTIGTTSVTQPQTIYTVKADHPFLFFLFLKRNPLFCGAYAGN